MRVASDKLSREFPRIPIRTRVRASVEFSRACSILPGFQRCEQRPCKQSGRGSRKHPDQPNQPEKLVPHALTIRKSHFITHELGSDSHYLGNIQVQRHRTDFTLEDTLSCERHARLGLDDAVWLHENTCR